jgi:hypothetical protein
MIPDNDNLNPRRRDVLATAAASATAAMTGCSPTARLHDDLVAPRSATASDVITRENQLPGAGDWQLTRVRLTRPDAPGKIGGYRSPWIEGYCNRQSVRAGEKLTIHVSTNPPQKWGLEIFRMGYYNGAGARLMQTLGPFNGVKQPEAPIGDRRLRECQWSPSVELTIPSDWVSGVYLGRLTTLVDHDKEGYWQSYVIFIVKDDRPADVLFQCSDNTWQAYNRWPDDYSLYVGGGGSALRSGRDVSFDRPYGKYVQILEHAQSVGSGEFLLWEYPLCYWLEKHGYDVTYCSNSDMVTPDRGLKCRSFISVGHDEYWDERQYHSVAAMRDAGVNLLFLSGNSVCFIAPYSRASDGRPNRIITRGGRYGGVRPEEMAGNTPMGPFSITGPNENLLIGARTIIPFNGGDNWTCVKPDHWIFRDTGMKHGDSIPGLVGWEFHGDPANIPGLDVVAEGTALSGGVKPAHWKATVYPGPKGNWVFNASTCWWAQGLSKPPGHIIPWSHWTRPHGPDDRVQRITANVLNRAITGSFG